MHYEFFWTWALLAGSLILILTISYQAVFLAGRRRPRPLLAFALRLPTHLSLAVVCLIAAGAIAGAVAAHTAAHRSQPPPNGSCVWVPP